MLYGSGLALVPPCELAGHLGENPRLYLPGCERHDEGDEPAVPGDEGRLPGLLDLAHDAGCLLVEFPHGEDQSFIVIDLPQGRLCAYWRNCLSASRRTYRLQSYR